MRIFGSPEQRGVPAGSQLIYSIAVVTGLSLFLALGSGCALYPDAKQWVKEATVGKDVPSDQELVEKSEVAIEHNDYSLAEIYLDAALQVNPTNPFALTNLGIVYKNTGREAEARALFTEVIREGSMAIADEHGDVEERKTVVLKAAEQLAQLDRVVVADTMRGLLDPVPTAIPAHPVHNLQSDWRERMDTRIAILQDLRARQYITEDELVARVGGAWLKAHAEPAPNPDDVLQRLNLLESMQRRGLLAPSAYAVERARILDALAPVKALPETEMLARAARAHDAQRHFVAASPPLAVSAEPMAPMSADPALANAAPMRHDAHATTLPPAPPKPRWADGGGAAGPAHAPELPMATGGEMAAHGAQDGHAAPMHEAPGNPMIHQASLRAGEEGPGEERYGAAAAGGHESSLPASVQERIRDILPPDHGPLVHLASYRTEQGARKAWDNLVRTNGDLLQGVPPMIQRVDLGPGQGVHYRVHGGPIADPAAAEALCAKFRARNLFCAVSG